MRAISPAEVLNGGTQLYVEVYGGLDGIELGTEYNGAFYKIYDRYCMNPGCDCEYVYLYFLRFKNGVETGFRATFFLKNKKYEIVETFHISKKEADKVIKHSLKDSDEAIQVFKRRYKEMKIAGRVALQDIVQMSRPNSRRPDRNAPCPCGSGKKYKKCCGAKVLQ